jgi:RNA polymerase sigma-70 factor, ECF subfamily
MQEEARKSKSLFELTGVDVGPSDALPQGYEADLVAGLQAGEPEAIKVVFNAYSDRLYSFVYHQVARNQAAAEDIVQETFAGAIKTAAKFKSNSRIYTWLVSIARHKIADHFRRMEREKKHNARSLDDRSSEQPELADDAPTAVEMMVSSEDRLLVEQALQKVPADYRQVLVLKYVEEMPVNEISLVMRRSPKSVEGLLSRAREMMRTALRDREGKGQDITTI